MPRLAQFRRKNLDGGTEFYALNIWEDGEPLAYVAKINLDFRLILNADAIAERYRTKGTQGLMLVSESPLHRLNKSLPI